MLPSMSMLYTVIPVGGRRVQHEVHVVCEQKAKDIHASPSEEENFDFASPGARCVRIP